MIRWTMSDKQIGDAFECNLAVQFAIHIDRQAAVRELVDHRQNTPNSPINSGPFLGCGATST